ncbi:hypothetical protein NXW48_22205 [Phocaeicola vulgatus]|nr:hypothetical protein [Phocaeicola vulgatus]
MLTLFVRVTSMYAGEGMDNHHFTEVHDIYVKDLKCKKVNVAALVLQGTEEKPGQRNNLRDFIFKHII